MEPLFNLESIYVTNVIGIVLIAVMIVCNLWRFQTRSRADRNLLLMMFLALTSCIADPISYSMKGVPGILPKISVYVTSSWLFAANMLASFFWVRFLSFHLARTPVGSERLIVHRGKGQRVPAREQMILEQQDVAFRVFVSPHSHSEAIAGALRPYCIVHEALADAYAVVSPVLRQIDLCVDVRIDQI